MPILTKIYTFFYIQDKHGEMYVILRLPDKTRGNMYEEKSCKSWKKSSGGYSKETGRT